MTDQNGIPTCHDCVCKMTPIRVGYHTLGDVQAQLAYSSMEKTKSWFSSYYRVEGVLTAFMCERCRTVRFYGSPLNES